jgi:hypothetical protein
MRLYVSKKALTDDPEHAVHVRLKNLDVARALRSSAGRAVILTDRLAYHPEMPA